MKKRIGRFMRWLASLAPFLPWAAVVVLSAGCQRSEYQQCIGVCSDLASICAQGSQVRPASHETVESARMCLESFALCRRACGGQP